MRLKKLLVSGFKSFVDVTDIRLPGRLVGVVGPNGCGKSNVIDAVRWVMGESSPRMLRGDNMTDVIFNGSSTRKPVGQASVELLFENNEGRGPGSYSQFAEISVKRTMNREGLSTYQINNMRTRRKDVLDLFRGTGLGPRSYSIIEQGMISQVIEAKPENLRSFIEEAAGTSRYKDRRKETESRIAHTRENLERVSDIREQHASQLRRLKRQAASARRYQLLKSEARTINCQLHALRYQELSEHLQEQSQQTATCEQNYRITMTRQQQSERNLETLHSQQTRAHADNSRIQQEYYRLNAEISNIEQKIQHQYETAQQRQNEIAHLANVIKTYHNQIEAEQTKSQALQQALNAMQPELASLERAQSEAATQLTNAESVLQNWVTEMEMFNEQSREPAQQIAVQKLRIDHLQQHLKRTHQNEAKLQQQQTTLTAQLTKLDIVTLQAQVTEQETQAEHGEQRLQECETTWRATTAQLEQQREQEANMGAQLQKVISRHNSLSEIQAAAAAHENSTELQQWLAEYLPAGTTTLAAEIQVESGWERAVDRVLNDYLGAICTETIPDAALAARPDCNFSILVQTPPSQASPRVDLARLQTHFTAGAHLLGALLADVYATTDLAEALKHQAKLVAGDCIVTRDAVLIGANWLNFASTSEIETGVLVREEEIKQLQQQKTALTAEVQRAQTMTAELEQQRAQQQTELDEQRTQQKRVRAELARLQNRFSREETRYLETRTQLGELTSQLDDLTGQMAGDENEIENAKTLIASAAKRTDHFDEQRNQLIQRRDTLKARVTTQRQQVTETTEASHQQALKKQQLEADMKAARENIIRYQHDAENDQRRTAQLQQTARAPSESIVKLQQLGQELSAQKTASDQEFEGSRIQLAEFETNITAATAQKPATAEAVETARETLEQQKLAQQEIVVRRDTLVETMQQQDFQLEEGAVDLPAEATVARWQQMLDALDKKIERLGAVNLVAIDDYETQQEELQNIDRQYADLTEALQTLDSVITKIDRETRARFRQTFEQINAGFKRFFPRLFGGGEAELQLTNNDLLTAGISVLARPPGKRNSHIHLLSGGEKALTAVALLFTIFELNPAPFCLLDEVDAPLDDTNVERYCETLKALAANSQMIVVTHNKITMAAMDLLVGVTMGEAGVSRLVSVDLQQAVQMAAA